MYRMHAPSIEAQGDTAAWVVLNLTRLYVRAQRVALFMLRDERLTLLGSDRLDQTTLNEVDALWSSPPLELLQGAPLRRSGVREILVLPCARAGVLWGLLHLQLQPGLPVLDAARVQELGEMVNRVLLSRPPEPETWEPDAVPQATSQHADAFNLESLLAHNEWNVSRVARLAGVARNTVYRRMRRARIGLRRALKQAGNDGVEEETLVR